MRSKAKRSMTCPTCERRVSVVRAVAHRDDRGDWRVARHMVALPGRQVCAGSRIVVE